MDNWKKISFLVGVFAFAREFRPIEPFYAAYMTSPYINCTVEQVPTELYSVGSYSMFVLIIIIFLVTDYVKYKPVLIVDGIGGVFHYTAIANSPSKLRIQFGQAFYGFFFSAEVALFGYLYAMVEEKEFYQKITGHARAATLTGKFFSSCLSQILAITYGTPPYNALVYMSIFGMSFTTVWAIFLPKVKYSLYFPNKKKVDETSMGQSTVTVYNPQKYKDSQLSIEAASNEEKIKNYENNEVEEEYSVVKELYKDFKQSYSDPYVCKLCFWWAVAMGGYLQVYAYINVLYTYVLEENEDTEFTLYNGAAESLNTLIGALSAFTISKVKWNWYSVGDIFFAIGSIIAAIVLLCCVYCRNLWYIYAFYIIYGMMYQTMLTIAESEVAKRLNKKCYGLIFGFNTFIAVCINTIIIYGVIQGHFIKINIAQQFLIYTVLYVVLAIFFFGSSILRMFRDEGIVEYN
ncbi:thiamine transporter 2-like [Melanaphis sacchari]|uniref:thiamine transporter 2-like n=1 Tax=Melanaphis sacchari TaxID=742174 RepID=UPI000DC149C8|nr:thiamine transporter 2-like [Melanaphis sacchari]XP_025195931.1 thiamine transporter 2-like [Melanaphis sacchari]XP_025195932.1 thiamine transporter 2-like [Melanaphis sacchari]XP_025195933.1 thiamine transporter 2-like [Melanaphis sacchari]